MRERMNKLEVAHAMEWRRRRRRRRRRKRRGKRRR